MCSTHISAWIGQKSQGTWPWAPTYRWFRWRVHCHGEPLTAWYNSESLANILALCDVRHCCCVTLNTDSDAARFVYLPNCGQLYFAELPSGLYTYLPNSPDNPKAFLPSSFLQTIASNRSRFTCREVEGADAVREQYFHAGSIPKTRTPLAVSQRSHLCNHATIHNQRRQVRAEGPYELVSEDQPGFNTLMALRLSYTC